MIDPRQIRPGAFYTFHGDLVRVVKIGKPKMRNDGNLHSSVEWFKWMDPQSKSKFNRLGTFAKGATERPDD